MSADDNKGLVMAFYERAFNDYQPEQAAEAHLGESYARAASGHSRRTCTSSPATVAWPSRTSGASPTGRSSSTGT